MHIFVSIRYISLLLFFSATALFQFIDLLGVIRYTFALVSQSHTKLIFPKSENQFAAIHFSLNKSEDKQSPAFLCVLLLLFDFIATMCLIFTQNLFSHTPSITLHIHLNVQCQQIQSQNSIAPIFCSKKGVKMLQLS